MNWVDLTLISLFSLFGLRGYYKGLFREIFSLAGLVAGFIVAVRYNEHLAAVLDLYWEAPPLLHKAIAFVAIFFMIYFLCSLFGGVLHRLEKTLFLQTFNRVGGIVVGIGKGATILAFVSFILASTSWLSMETKDKMEASYLATPLARLGESIVQLGKEAFFSNSQGDALSRSERRFA